MFWKVFGFELVEIESNRYILVNEVENKLPHLIFHNSSKQLLLYLVLVHIFMHGEACQEGDFNFIWEFYCLFVIDNNDMKSDLINANITYEIFLHRYIMEFSPQLEHHN